MTVDEEVGRYLRTDPRVANVQLVGSRKQGRAGPLSDWDLVVDTTDVEGTVNAIPRLLEPLKPIYQFLNPLPEEMWNYIIMLPGPVIVDLHFQQELQPEPPWRMAAENLQLIDTHFWDWVLYMARKSMKGEDGLVISELHKMHWYLLSPMGVTDSPTIIKDAIEVSSKSV